MSAAQIKKLHALKREIGLDGPTYRKILKDLTGYESSTALSTDQLSKVIEYLNGKKTVLKSQISSAEVRNQIHEQLKAMDKGIEYAKGIFARISSRKWAEASLYQLQQVLKALQEQAKREGVMP
jgi:phage gp16-like protein